MARLHGVTEAGSITYQTVEATAAGAAQRLQVIGHKPGRSAAAQAVAEGRGIKRSHFEMIADAKSGLATGDVFRLGRNPFKVVGLVSDTTNSAGDPAALPMLADAQVLQSQLAPPAQRVKTARGAGLLESQDTVAAVIARLDPNPARWPRPCGSGSISRH
ncbi:MAG: ABC transporter permease [Paracoccaceae bacterium]